MLRLVFGPMYAGKTFHCIRLARRYRAIDKKVLFVDNVIDNRYSTSHVVTHDGDKEECVFVKELKELENLLEYIQADVIIVEEAQFFPDLVQFIIKECDKNEKQFIVSGLSGDSQRKGIGHILDLVPHAEHVDKLNGMCHQCKDGTAGSFTRRLYTEDEKGKQQIFVGGKESYECVCRKHFLEK